MSRHRHRSGHNFDLLIAERRIGGAATGEDVPKSPAGSGYRNFRSNRKYRYRILEIAAIAISAAASESDSTSPPITLTSERLSLDLSVVGGLNPLQITPQVLGLLPLLADAARKSLPQLLVAVVSHYARPLRCSSPVNNCVTLRSRSRFTLARAASIDILNVDSWWAYSGRSA
jgi:hypothetical protein